MDKMPNVIIEDNMAKWYSEDGVYRASECYKGDGAAILDTLNDEGWAIVRKTTIDELQQAIRSLENRMTEKGMI